MRTSSPPSVGDRIDDLLCEKTLYAIYMAARRIPTRKFNPRCGALATVVGIALSCADESPGAIAAKTLSLSTVMFSTIVSLLGFLIAGFSFYATVADKSLFCRMAEIPHRESGLSYLKYNAFTFMIVFVDYLVVGMVSLAIMVVLSDGSASRGLVATRVSGSLGVYDVARIATGSVLFGSLLGMFVYVLLQLKSFIFNINHVTMTSVAWVMHGGDEECGVGSTIEGAERSDEEVAANADRPALPATGE